MKGHIRERSPGKWAIVLDVRDPSTGKVKRRWHSFRGSKRGAQAECARLITELKGGTYIDPSKLTVATFLERWLEHIKPNVAPRTYERYAEIVRKNLDPALGAVMLTKLQPMTISAAYSKALASGRRDGSGGLSPRTVHHMHRILRQALGQGVKWRLLTRNPTDAVDPPRVERQPLKTYDLAQTVQLIETLRPTRMHVPTLLAVLCGLRRGEIAALRWGNVDLENGQIAIEQSAEQTRGDSGAVVRLKEPKSGRGRTVALSATMITELKAHRVSQAVELLRLGVALAPETFVVAQADGAPLQPNSLTHEWTRLLASTTLPRVRFHDLRHAHATHLLASGVHPKVASERLGHSKVGITLDLYSHVLPGMQEDAAARVDDALRAALEKRAAGKSIA